MSFETLVMMTAWLFATGMMLYGTWLSLRRLRSAPPNEKLPFEKYPVSILKPLKGTDAGIHKNLLSFFQLDYPTYEIIFSVADDKDPVIPIVRRLMSRYPKVPSRLIIGEVDVGPNPKVNNLIKSYESAKHDWILISDSNVRVNRNYLRRVVAHIGPDVGVVTAVVAGRGAETFGGRLESVFLNTFYARWMNLTERFGQACVLGKSMLFRRSTAAKFGGIRALAPYLAEDYRAGKEMEQLGLRVELMTDAVEQHIGPKYSLKDFWRRHIRWGRLRKSQAPLPFIFEPFVGSIPSGLLGAAAFSMTSNVSFTAFITMHLLFWSACDYLLMRKLTRRVHFQMAVAWFAREILYLPLWAHIAIGNTVLWRGQRLKLAPGGLLAPQESDAMPAVSTNH